MSVSAQQLDALRAWVADHPITPIVITGRFLPVVVFNKRKVYFPSSIRIHHKEFDLLQRFGDPTYVAKLPNAKTTVRSGGMGDVATYLCQKDQSMIVVKATVLKSMHDESFERDAYEVLRFLNSKHLLPHGCMNRLIHLTAGSTVLVEKGVYESLMAIEKMDLDLNTLLAKTNVFATAHGARTVLRSLFESVACLHQSRPLPIAHGDLKPANLLCSPYQDHWLLSEQPVDRCADSSKVYVKTADFDSAFLNTWPMSRSAPPNVKTRAFVSPERARTDGPPSLEDDMWACGQIMFVCITRRFSPVSDLLEQYIEVDENNIMHAIDMTMATFHKTVSALGWTERDARHASSLLYQLLNEPIIDVQDALLHPFLAC